MKTLDLIQTASSNMFRSKVRTFLTIIAIFIGAMTITLTNGIGTGVKTYLNRQIGNLGATNVLLITLNSKTTGTGVSGAPVPYVAGQRVATTQFRGGGGETQVLMSSTDIDTIAKVPNIQSVAPQRSISPDYIGTQTGKYRLTINEQFGESTADMQTGQGVSNKSSAYQITIPESYVGPLGFKSNQDSINKTVVFGITDAYGTQNEVNATITGVQQKALIGSTVIYSNSSLGDKLYSLQSNGLPASTTNYFPAAQATFPSNFTDAQITIIKNDLSAKNYTATTIKDRENTIFTALNVVIIILDMFGVIALLAASFGIINTLYMAVQERTKEIGLMKALGMSPRKIFILFSIEAVLIGFWGSVLGVAFAAIVGNIINTVAAKGFLKDFPGLTLLTFPLSTVLIVVLGIMLIAFLAGTLPALRASKKDPIDALRYE